MLSTVCLSLLTKLLVLFVLRRILGTVLLVYIDIDINVVVVVAADSCQPASQPVAYSPVQLASSGYVYVCVCVGVCLCSVICGRGSAAVSVSGTRFCLRISVNTLQWISLDSTTKLLKLKALRIRRNQSARPSFCRKTCSSTQIILCYVGAQAYCAAAHLSCLVVRTALSLSVKLLLSRLLNRDATSPVDLKTRPNWKFFQADARARAIAAALQTQTGNLEREAFSYVRPNCV